MERLVIVRWCNVEAWSSCVCKDASVDYYSTDGPSGEELDSGVVSQESSAGGCQAWITSNGAFIQANDSFQNMLCFGDPMNVDNTRDALMQTRQSTEKVMVSEHRWWVAGMLAWISKSLLWEKCGKWAVPMLCMSIRNTQSPVLVSHGWGDANVGLCVCRVYQMTT